MTLEERLAQFVDWLKEQDVELCVWTPDLKRKLPTKERVALIHEFVNT